MPANGVTVLSPVPDMRKYWKPATEPYVYSQNNPTNLFDPGGLRPGAMQALANQDNKKDESKPMDIELPPNAGDCKGLCIGVPKTGGQIELKCDLTSFTAHPENGVFCPAPNDVKSGCKMLLDRLKKIQDENKQGWGLNLCGICGCDWDNGKYFTKEQSVRMKFEKTELGQQVGAILCRYTVSGSLTLTVKSGDAAIAPCKPKC